jgi:hypothetical protein
LRRSRHVQHRRVDDHVRLPAQVSQQLLPGDAVDDTAVALQRVGPAYIFKPPYQSLVVCFEKDDPGVQVPVNHLGERACSASEKDRDRTSTTTANLGTDPVPEPPAQPSAG